MECTTESSGKSKGMTLGDQVFQGRSAAFRFWFPRLLLAFGAAIWLALIAASWAEAADDSDDYDFKWLDPEKRVYVLQNRKFRKSNRLLLSVMAGPGLSNPYRTATQIMPRVAYYFSEAWGIELFYGMTSNSQNNTFRALMNSSPTTLPVVREMRSELGGLLHWIPWYSKINVFNKILYFDWYFAGGAGTMKSGVGTSASGGDAFAAEDLFALYLGTGHQYHLSRVLSFRLDFTGAFYRAPIFGTTGDRVWFSNYTFGVGLGVRI